MANIKFELTEAQAQQVINHILTDLSFGEGGTFGDGETYFKQESMTVERAVKTMQKAYNTQTPATIDKYEIL